VSNASRIAYATSEIILTAIAFNPAGVEIRQTSPRMPSQPFPEPDTCCSMRPLCAGDSLLRAQ